MPPAQWQSQGASRKPSRAGELFEPELALGPAAPRRRRWTDASSGEPVAASAARAPAADEPPDRASRPSRARSAQAPRSRWRRWRGRPAPSAPTLDGHAGGWSRRGAGTASATQPTPSASRQLTASLAPTEPPSSQLPPAPPTRPRPRGRPAPIPAPAPVPAPAPTPALPAPVPTPDLHQPPRRPRQPQPAPALAPAPAPAWRPHRRRRGADHLPKAAPAAAAPRRGRAARGHTHGTPGTRAGAGAPAGSARRAGSRMPKARPRISEACCSHQPPPRIVCSSSPTLPATPGRPGPRPSISLRIRASLMPIRAAACAREALQVAEARGLALALAETAAQRLEQLAQPRAVVQLGREVALAQRPPAPPSPSIPTRVAGARRRERCSSIARRYVTSASQPAGLAISRPSSTAAYRPCQACA